MKLRERPKLSRKARKQKLMDEIDFNSLTEHFQVSQEHVFLGAQRPL